jgi:spoIIIJ-associated protein
MDAAREFEGRTLEEAIAAACAYFDLPREKLEVDIIRDAKSGIFGIVGVRKAVIRARRDPLSANVDELLHTPLRDRAHAHAPETRPQSVPHAHPDEGRVRPARDGSAGDPPQADPEPSRRKPEKRETTESEAPARVPHTRQSGAEGNGRGHIGQKRGESAGPPPPSPDEQTDGVSERFDRQPYVSAASLDRDKVLEAARDIAVRLVAPIVPGADVDVDISRDRVVVRVDSSGDIGLLIGREGQTLSCVQYLASRMLARRVGALVHVQIDAGDYRERQEDKLRELALLLARRAKATGRMCPTRPLSSYHRRIVHMALQDDPAIQTRSSGEGSLKRVIIQRAHMEQ